MGNSFAGKFIVFEGIEGVNLKDLAQRTAQEMEQRGVPKGQIFLTREPSDGPIGRDIRLALRGRLELDPRTVAVLFAADRLDHLYTPKTGIEARLEKGEWVLLDRYYLSQYAFQTYQGFDLEWLQALNRHARRPDLTLYIELPLDACIRTYQAQVRRQGYHYSLLGVEKIAVPDQEGYENARKYLGGIRERYLEAIKTLESQEPIEVIEANTEGEAIKKIRYALRKRGWLS